MYDLSVTKRVENPDFDKQLEAYRQFDRQRVAWTNEQVPSYPDKYYNANVLTVQLNEEEYQAIKRAVLETFK